MERRQFQRYNQLLEVSDFIDEDEKTVRLSEMSIHFKDWLSLVDLNMLKGVTNLHYVKVTSASDTCEQQSLLRFGPGIRLKFHVLSKPCMNIY